MQCIYFKPWTLVFLDNANKQKIFTRTFSTHCRTIYKYHLSASSVFAVAILAVYLFGKGLKLLYESSLIIWMASLFIAAVLAVTSGGT